jgi:NADH dehydrogenase FAD-containing subunit
VSLYPESINPNDGSVTVNRFLQIAKKPQPDSDESEIRLVDENIFVVGDTADAFGALQAGHTAWAQAEVAVRNIARLVEAEKPVKLRRKMDVEQTRWEEAKVPVEEELEKYTPPPPAIKVSLGLVSRTVAYVPARY